MPSDRTWGGRPEQQVGRSWAAVGMTLPAAGSAAPSHRERRSAQRRDGQLATTSSPDLLGKHPQVGKLVIRTDVDHVKSCMFQSVAICTRTAYAVFALRRSMAPTRRKPCRQQELSSSVSLVARRC